MEVINILKVLKVIFSLVIILITTSCFSTARKEWSDFASLTEEDRLFLNDLVESGEIENKITEYFLSNYGTSFPLSISNVEYFYRRYPAEQFTKEVTDMIEFDVTIDLKPTIKRKFYAMFDDEKNSVKILLLPDYKNEEKYVNSFLLEERIVSESLRTYYDKLFFGKSIGYDHYTDLKVVSGEKIYATIVNVCMQENKFEEIIQKYSEGYFDNIDSTKEKEIVSHYVDGQCLINGDINNPESGVHYFEYSCNYSSSEYPGMYYYVNRNNPIANVNLYEVIFYPVEGATIENQTNTKALLSKMNDIEYYKQIIDPITIRGCYETSIDDPDFYENYAPPF